MKDTEAREKKGHHIFKYAVLSILILSAAALLFSCGGDNPDTSSMGPATFSKSSALDVQCTDGASLAAGANHTVGLKGDGTVVAVGANGYGQLNVSSWTKIKAIAAGANHTVGLAEDGTVAAAGANGYGQLSVSSWTNIKTIAAGQNHTIGIREDGTVTAAGNNGYGQSNVSSWTNIMAVAAGYYHTVGVKDDGTVVAAGDNRYGQSTVSSWTNITAVAAGSYHTVGLKEDGTVVAAGNSGYGQLKVSSWTNIKAIAAGLNHTVGLKEDGTVVATGYNGYGQLGVSSWTNIKAIAAGANYTIGLKEDGTLAAAGANSSGQLNVSSLFTNIMPLCGPARAEVQDAAAPVTMVTVTGTPGNNGWYVSDVQVALTAADGDGGSGVNRIHYRVDGAETVVEGSSASFSITGDGTHTVAWFAVDNEENAETPQEMTINIDTTDPEVSALVTDPSILWPPNRKMIDVFIGGSAADAGSGIASTAITVTDEYGVYTMSVTGFGNAVQLEAWRNGSDRDGRVYTITAVATDQAGNQSTGTTTVLVPHDMR